ncbi:DNA-directed RNA polymerase, partial [Streptococcus uberis]
CSGIQHLSALSKNIDIGKLVNLINNEDQSPNDFYTFAINKSIEAFNTIEDLEFREKTLKLKYSRK